MSNQNDELDQQIEIFKVKKLIKNLEAARGNGTSMISLIIPPGTQISQISKMLSDEYGTASNIKSRVNRLSVLGAITSTQQRLKLYSKCPKVSWVGFCVCDLFCDLDCSCISNGNSNFVLNEFFM